MLNIKLFKKATAGIILCLIASVVNAQDSKPDALSDARQAVVAEAQKHLGAPYRRGGMGPS